MQELLLNFLKDGSISVANFLLDNYVKLGMTNDEFLLYLQIKKEQSRGYLFPPMDRMATSLGMSNQVLFATIQSLQDKNLLEINQRKNEQGASIDFYDFTLLYQKMAALVETNDQKLESVDTRQSQSNHDIQSIFDQIQMEFGRALSPIEMETISQWINKDHFSEELIRLALKEAVLNQAYNLKYMDRILLNWEQRNLKTPQQVERSLNQRSNNSDNRSVSTESVRKKKVDIPIIKLTQTNE